MERFVILLIACILSLNSFGQKLSISDQKTDIDTLCCQIIKVHPNPFRYISKRKFLAKRDSLKNIIKESATPSSFYLLTAPLLASIQDGHCSMEIPVDERIEFTKNGGKVMPLAIRLNSDCLVVNYPCVDSRLQLGDTLKSINGISSSEIMRRIFSLQGSEINNELKCKVLARNLNILLWYMFGWSEKFTFEVLRGNKVISETMEGISSEKYLAAIRQHPQPKKSFSLEYIDKKTAKIVIPNFYQLDEMKAFCDSAFAKMETDKIALLYLDLTGNPGGAEEGIEVLMNYFKHPAYKIYSDGKIKVSEVSKVYQKRNHPENYELIKIKRNGELITFPKEPLIPSNDQAANVYNGKLVVLVDGQTYSAASTFAHLISKNKIGEVKGITGCPTIYTGNYLAFQLPNSKLKYYITTCLFRE